MSVGEEDNSSSGQSQTRSQPESKKKTPHYLAKCVLNGSVVLQAIHGHFLSPFSSDVVFGKGSFSYKLPIDDILKGCDGAYTFTDSSENSIVTCTLLGSVIIFIPISRKEHELLEAVQAKLVDHPLTAPVLGNDHNEFRRRGSPAGVPKILDGDMLAQFLELTSMQQEAVLPLRVGVPEMGTSFSNSLSHTHLPVNQVVRLLERVHHAVN